MSMKLSLMVFSSFDYPMQLLYYFEIVFRMTLIFTNQ